jgi:hypothetical protein
MNDTFISATTPTSLAEWRRLPDDVKAGIFEEIDEMREQDRAEHHWAWPFVQPFLDQE